MSLHGVMVQLLAWLLLVGGLSLLSALIFPLAQRLVVKLGPAAQSRWLSLYAALPVLSASASLLIYRSASLSHWLVDDHCHADQCGPHALYLPVSNAFSVTLLVAGFILTAVFLAGAILQIRTNARFSGSLKLVADNSPQRHYHIIESPQAAAWCAGLWHPQIYVSRGLIDQSTSRQLNLVVQHEICHARHLDNLKLMLVRWLTLPWPGNPGQAYLKAINNATELRCDLYALAACQIRDPGEIMPQICKTASQNPAGRRAAELTRAMQQQRPRWLESTLAYAVLVLFLLVFTLFAVSAGHPFIEFLMQ